MRLLGTRSQVQFFVEQSQTFLGLEGDVMTIIAEDVLDPLERRGFAFPIDRFIFSRYS